MKICSKCDQEQELTEYGKHSSRPDGLQDQCRSCRKAYGNAWYHKTKDQHRESRRVSRERTEKRNRAIINEWKNGGCIGCGEDDIVALDAHHLDPTVKEHHVSQMLGNSENKLRSELEKCVCLCANCHRKLHASLAKQ